MKRFFLVFLILFFASTAMATEMIWNGELEAKVFAPLQEKGDASTAYGNFYLDMTAKVDEYNEVLYEFGATGPGTNYTVDEVYINTDFGKMYGWKNGFKTRIGHANLKSKDFSLMTDYAYEKDSTRDGFKSGGFLIKPSVGKFYGQYGFASYKGDIEDQALIGVAGIGSLVYAEISHNSYDPSIFGGMHLKMGDEKLSGQLLCAYKHIFFKPEKENFYGLSTKFMVEKVWVACAVGGNNAVFPALASAETGYDNGKVGALAEASWGDDTGWRTAEVYIWKNFGKLKLKPGFKATPDGNYGVMRAIVTW